MTAKQHDPKNPHVKGLPRPVASHVGYNYPLPVPYSQDVELDGRPSWGKIGPEYQGNTFRRGCLVCGETVKEGVVLLGYLPGAQKLIPPLLMTESMARKCGLRIVDSGPMHNRCFTLAHAHCNALRARIENKEFVSVPYRLER